MHLVDGQAISWVNEDWMGSVDDLIREDTLHAMEELRREQGEVFWDIFALISRADPEGLLGMGSPPNEYVTEAQDIYSRLPEARSERDVRQIIEDELHRRFRAGLGEHGTAWIDPHYEMKIPGTDLDRLAGTIWRTWRVEPQAEKR
ncbi:MAG TPA: hypothetical protein VF221_05655 [Chloroflexota bacterium]